MVWRILYITMSKFKTYSLLARNRSVRKIRRLRPLSLPVARHRFPTQRSSRTTITTLINRIEARDGSKRTVSPGIGRNEDCFFFGIVFSSGKSRFANKSKGSEKYPYPLDAVTKRRCSKIDFTRPRRRFALGENVLEGQPFCSYRSCVGHERSASSSR